MRGKPITPLLKSNPTGQLDTATGSNIIGPLRHAVDELGLTVLVASHDPKVEEAADRVIHLIDGRKAAAPADTA